ncbi:MAG: EutN/CcmL family microcompartment protein [Myxococcales bacterium]|nr:EutN/CcmL family microcompartment protein [Myxococcales bacterium]MCB9908285.1 EutN/CcmL family microcompartment protein [Planctomycetota bacterium]MCB9908756.1 EutN/CcmL family microcompartment protein [Planctomycetota bacterium]MCB9912419.1 EutN/CcmL family microcompartment protein [Planctomycetota bacterium]HPF14457.1 EutN/CcmL family microcompartment protein [Planctomycetota bacterium]
MFLADVIGTVVAPIQVPSLVGRTHLMVRPVGPTGQPAGNHRIAIDTVGAGVGDRVLVVDEGNSARQVLGNPQACQRTVIVGFVDSVSLEGRRVYDHTTETDRTSSPAR